ncbi:MAG: hypothetical protein H6R14_2070 [Proteobacteria bacterium]|nr:hypothetical protein [Pseudomonadota bacterium]
MTLSNDNRPWYKERWPWFLMAGPGTVIIAGVITVWLAVVSNDGLVTDDYYKQGLAVNQSLQRDHHAGNIGLHGDVMRSGSNLRLLLGADGDAGLPSEIVLKLAHPTRAGQDQLITMKMEGQGFYSGKLAEEVSGRWLVSIEDPAGQWRLQGEWLADLVEPLRLTARAAK